MDVIDMQKLKPCNRENQLMVSDMTLRDHFAGMAMQAYISTDPAMLHDDEDIAQWSYAAADAMMEERLK